MINYPKNRKTLPMRILGDSVLHSNTKEVTVEDDELRKFVYRQFSFYSFAVGFVEFVYLVQDGFNTRIGCGTADIHSACGGGNCLEQFFVEFCHGDFAVFRSYNSSINRTDRNS